ncbi:MAG: glycosyltransferase [Chitinophagales bacterium]|nr:glycosyltransferase [Chitinophagales bacterium]
MGFNNIYLSIVLCGRNDNYGGDFIQRLQHFFDWNVTLLEHFKIDNEIILVNWNPNKENLPLEQLVRFQPGRRYTSIRIITVTHETHLKYENPTVRKTVPIFEFVAKNAGIRRAKGEYILCVNADVLIHPKIFKYISQKNLCQDYYYRANRIDFTKFTGQHTLSLLWRNGFVVSLKGFMYRFHYSLPIILQYHALRLFNYGRIKWELWKKNNHEFCNRWHISVNYDNAEYYASTMSKGRS